MGPFRCLRVSFRVTPPSQESTWPANRSAATASAAEKAVAAAVAANQSLGGKEKGGPVAGSPLLFPPLSIASRRTSPILVVRSFIEPVSEPIRASSNDGAIFELLKQTGGRMPGHLEDR